MNRNGANILPRITPVTISKKTVSPSSEQNCFFVEHHYSSNSFFGENMLEEFVPAFRYVWNQMPWRNLQTRVLPQDLFAHIPLMIQQIVRIPTVVDQFLKKKVLIFL